MKLSALKTKKDILNSFNDLLGLNLEIGKGSSVPSALFKATARVARVSEVGQMPIVAERVVKKAGLTWGREHDSTHSRSGGGGTVTFQGLKRLLEAVLILEGKYRTPNEFECGETPELDDSLGVPYIHRSSSIQADPKVIEADWQALDQATQAHQLLEKKLAEFAKANGVLPLSPKQSEPQYDIAWEYAGTTVVVEVKSANESNRRQQARLGIGQVLEFVALLRDADEDRVFRPALLLGIEPDNTDYLLAHESGVTIIGPNQFNYLFIEDLAPGSDPSRD